MYGTTKEFLERLGINDLSDLPSLGDFIPGAEVVEALEHGLRPVDPTDPSDSTDSTGATEATDLTGEVAAERAPDTSGEPYRSE